jgi:hypothetical protein
MLTHWIETDTYDRAAFERLCADSPSLQALAASGSKLLPHFDGFLLDLYALLYKMNVVFHAQEQVTPAAVFYRFLLEELRGAQALDVLRQQTALDEGVAGLATLLLGEALLELLKSERVLTRGEMLDVWSLEQQGDEIDGRAEHAETADALRAALAGQSAERQLAELQNRLQRENAAAERHRAVQTERLRQDFADGAARRQPRVTAQVERALQDLETTREDTEQWSLHLGGRHQSSPARRSRLGHQLAHNPKLKRMAQLVGRMRERRALRRRCSSANAGCSVGLGASSAYCRPGTRPAPPVLRRDFSRRASTASCSSTRCAHAKGAGRWSSASTAAPRCGDKRSGRRPSR